VGRGKKKEKWTFSRWQRMERNANADILASMNGNRYYSTILMLYSHMITLFANNQKVYFSRATMSSFTVTLGSFGIRK